MSDYEKWLSSHNINSEDYGMHQTNASEQTLQERRDHYNADLARARNEDRDAYFRGIEERNRAEFDKWWNTLTPEQKIEYRKNQEQQRIIDEDHKAQYEYDVKQENLRKYQEQREREEQERIRRADQEMRHLDYERQENLRKYQEQQEREEQERTRKTDQEIRHLEYEREENLRKYQEQQEREEQERTRKKDQDIRHIQYEMDEKLEKIKPVIAEEIKKVDFTVKPNNEAVEKLAKYYKGGVENSVLAFQDDYSAFDDVAENLKYLNNDELKEFIKVQVEFIKANYENKITDWDIQWSSDDLELRSQQEVNKRKAEKFQNALCVLAAPLLYKNIESKRENPNLEPSSEVLNGVDLSAFNNEKKNLDILDAIIISNELYPYNYVDPVMKETAEIAVSNYEEKISLENRNRDKLAALENAKKAYNEMSPLKKFLNKKLIEKMEKMETAEQIENTASRFSR